MTDDEPSEEALPLHPALRPLVFAQWIHVLASSELQTTQHGADSEHWIFSKYPEGHEIRFKVLDSETLEYELRVTGFARSRVEKLAVEARDRVERGELGEYLWYLGELSSPQPGMEAFTSGDLLRILGNAVHIEGWRRLGPEVLVKFASETSDQSSPSLFVPSHSISTFILVPGTTPGPLGDHVVKRVCELVRLICTFALARIVEAPFAIFPANSEASTEAWTAHRDTEVGTLARGGVSLDLFGELAPTGGWELVDKIARSLGAYEAAIRSRNPDVATILYVAGLEALISPSTPGEWRRERLMRRFVTSILAYAPEAVSAILEHPNCGEAFGVPSKGSPARKRKRLLEKIYNLRSEGVHTGPSLSLAGLVMEPSNLGARSALLCNLHTAVILAFLSSPRSMLYGHPEIDPPSDAV